MPQFWDTKDKFALVQEQLQQIERHLIQKRYKRGAVIFTEEDSADGLYLIRSGYVKVYQESEDGREKTLAILARGDVIGEMAAFSQHIRSATVKTLEPTEVLFIPQNRFEELLRTTPAFSLLITEIVTERLREANKQLAYQAHCGSHDKVICQVLSLIEKHGGQHKRGLLLQPRLTHGDIASLAGVARETVTKVFKELADKGIVKFEARKLLVLDLPGLRDSLKKE